MQGHIDCHLWRGYGTADASVVRAGGASTARACDREASRGARAQLNRSTKYYVDVQDMRVIARHPTFI